MCSPVSEDMTFQSHARSDIEGPFALMGREEGMPLLPALEIFSHLTAHELNEVSLVNKTFKALVSEKVRTPVPMIRIEGRILTSFEDLPLTTRMTIRLREIETIAKLFFHAIYGTIKSFGSCLYLYFTLPSDREA